MANLYSTFAKGATLRITAPSEVLLEDASSNPMAEASPDGLLIPLGNLQYGQSRDTVIATKLPPHYQNSWSATAHLRYTFGNEMKTASAGLETEWELSERSVEMWPETAQYHTCRAKMCSFLTSLFPMKADGEHVANDQPTSPAPQSDEPDKSTKMEQLRELVAWIQSSAASHGKLIQSLLQDLTGTEPQGQVRIALASHQEFLRWGQHYRESNSFSYQSLAKEVLLLLIFPTQYPLFFTHTHARFVILSKTPGPYNTAVRVRSSNAAN